LEDQGRLNGLAGLGDVVRHGLAVEAACVSARDAEISSQELSPTLPGCHD
jgi:hypothetical protein